VSRGDPAGASRGAYLAVEDDREAAVRGRHGLGARGGQIDDREPAVPEAHVGARRRGRPSHPDAAPVGTPVAERPGHGLEPGRIDGPRREDPANPALGLLAQERLDPARVAQSRVDAEALGAVSRPRFPPAQASSGQRSGGQRARLAGRHEESRAPVLHHLRRPADRRGHHGNRAGHGLEHAHGNAFLPARQRDHVAAWNDRLHIGPHPREDLRRAPAA
jgi:hypothetical protein